MNPGSHNECAFYSNAGYEPCPHQVPAFMTCDDKREKCTLDCVLSVYLGESDQVCPLRYGPVMLVHTTLTCGDCRRLHQEGELAACRLGCIKEHTECVDSDEVSAAMEVNIRTVKLPQGVLC